MANSILSGFKDLLRCWKGKESIAEPIASEEWKLFRFPVIKDIINYSLLLIVTNYQLQYLCSCLYDFFYSTH